MIKLLIIALIIIAILSIAADAVMDWINKP